MKKLFCFLAIVFLSQNVYAAENVGKANPIIEVSNPLGENKGYIHHSNGKKYDIDKSYKALFINGTIIENPNIVTKSDRTLLPLRLVSETLGAKVDWNDKTRTVTVKNNIVNITLTIGSKNADINGKKVILDVPPEIIHDYTYLPLRFISESLNCNVKYFDPNINNKVDSIIYTIPTVFVDSLTVSEVAISKDEAIKIAKNENNKGLDNFKKTFNSEFSFIIESWDKKDIDKVFNEIQKSIDNIKIVSEVSRYYKMSGPYDILFDKYTGEMFFSDEGRIQFITKFEANNKKLYISKHFVG